MSSLEIYIYLTHLNDKYEQATAESSIKKCE